MSHSPSPAYEQAHADPSARATPADAFVRARAHYRAGDKLDVRALALELAIPRATLYRWIGDRERLLADVIWADFELLIDHMNKADIPDGLPGIMIVVELVLGAASSSEPLKAFLRNEGDRGLVIVTSPIGGVRPRIVESFGAYIADQARAGHYNPPATPLELADGILTISEYFLWTGSVNDFHPDPATALRLARLLLREDTPSQFAATDGV